VRRISSNGASEEVASPPPSPPPPSLQILIMQGAEDSRSAV
jgi:hypothetical protein